MKRINLLKIGTAVVIGGAALALIIVGIASAFSNKLAEDHSALLRDGYVYRVTYQGNGGDFSSARNVRLYFKTDGIKTADPVTDKFVPTKVEQFVREWYRKVITTDANGIQVVQEIPWNFETDRIDESFMEPIKDKKTGITYYDLELFPRWEYYLYVDYCISYVELDKETYKGTLYNGEITTDLPESGGSVVTNEFRTQEEFLSYRGRNITHSTGTRVPVDYDPLKHANIKNSDSVLPMFYADPELTEPITFPLNSRITPKPLEGENRIKVYVKFFDIRFNIISTATELAGLTDANYYLWRSVDFRQVTGNNQFTKKSISAGVSFSDKIFLGNGHTISNLSFICNQISTSESLGIFGLFKNSQIKDVTFKDCTVYYNLTDHEKSVDLGLIAGKIVGAQSVISNVNFENVHGYVRNSRTDLAYSANYDAVHFGYATKDASIPTSSINVNLGEDSFIKVLNMYISTPDTKEIIGYDVWQGHSRISTSNNGAYIETGNYNQTLTQREIGDNGRETGYYIIFKISLSEIEGVYISILNTDEDGNYVYELASELDFVEQTDGTYLLTKYVSENTKAGRIVVKWNDEDTDSYDFLSRGGSGNLDAARNLSYNQQLSVNYNDYTQTLTYSSTSIIKNYTPTGSETPSLTTRPAGYSIPLRLRLFTNPQKDTVTNQYPDIEITINGVVYNVSELEFQTFNSVSSNFHYLEYWQKLDKDNPNTEVVVSFYGGRYTQTFKIVAAEGVTFEEPATPAPASASASVMPVQAILPKQIAI